MARIFTVSQSGKLTEYESSEYALAANEFATVEFVSTARYRRFQFLRKGISSDTLQHKNWKLRLEDISHDFRVKCYFIDRNGMIQHYYPNSQGFDALSELIVKFVQVTEFNDLKDVELYQREEALQNEHTSLQEQINELKAAIEVLKEKLELSPNEQ